MTKEKAGMGPRGVRGKAGIVLSLLLVQICSKTPQWMLETSGSTKPYIYYIFLIHTYDKV